MKGRGAEPSELLDQVKDAATFLVFVRVLAAERADSVARETTTPSSPYGAETLGWENTTIEAFLSGAIAWAEVSDFGLKQGLSSDNHWRQFATFLYCGKIYE